MAKRDRNSSAEHARRLDVARQRGFSSAYTERIARAEARYPDMSRRFYRGHRTPDERAILAFARAVRRSPEGSQVLFAGIERQPDGTWRVGRFDLLPGDGSDIVAIEVEPSPLWHEIEAAMTAAGIVPIGGKYLQAMLEWIDKDIGDMVAVAEEEAA